MCLWLKGRPRSRCLSCSIFVRIKIVCHPVSHVISLLVSTSLSLFQSTTRSTTWTARPSPRRHCTPRPSSKNYTVATIKNRSRTSITRAAETCAQKVMSLMSLLTKELATISGSSLEDIYQLYDVQREFGEQDQQAPIIEEGKEF